MGAERLRIEHHRALESTQERAHELAAAGAGSGTIVVADEQTRGRGTRGREWHSGSGGLWLTAVIRPEAAPALEGLSLRVGLAIAAALEPLVPAALKLKWPNDLYARDRKLGGILCEARWVGEVPGWVAVGVGINARNRIPESLADGAIGLAELGFPGEPADLVAPVADAIMAAGAETGPLTAAELARFAERDWLLGRRVIEPVAGTAAGVTPDGHLLIAADDGRRVPVLTGLVLARAGGSR